MKVFKTNQGILIEKDSKFYLMGRTGMRLLIDE